MLEPTGLDCTEDVAPDLLTHLRNTSSNAGEKELKDFFVRQSEKHMEALSSHASISSPAPSARAKGQSSRNKLKTAAVQYLLGQAGDLATESANNSIESANKANVSDAAYLAQVFAKNPLPAKATSDSTSAVTVSDIPFRLEAPITSAMDQKTAAVLQAIRKLRAEADDQAKGANT